MDKKELTNRLRNSIRENKTKYRSHIFDIGDNLIAKKSKMGWTQNEYEVNQFLYENGVSVPEALELIKPDNLLRRLFTKCIDSSFFIRKDIPGQTISSLDYDDSSRKLAYEECCKEVEKARRLGVNPSDYGSYNAIFNPQEKKVYLIDFESWEI